MVVTPAIPPALLKLVIGAPLKFAVLPAIGSATVSFVVGDGPRNQRDPL